MTQTPTRNSRWGDAEDPASMITMEQLYAQDTRPVPPVLFERSTRDDVPTDPVPADVFTSSEYASKEFDNLWLKVWQSTCREREIPNPGDYFEYEIGDQSVLIVRNEGGAIRAFHNVCLHRGARLVGGQGGATEFKCSFHGWTWNTDGSLKSIPCRWDFPNVDDKAYSLKEIRAGTWNGFVFINFDTEAGSLEEFLGDTVPRHFETWPMTNRFKAAHVARVVNSNWKVALEAFLEVYHAFRTHPQTVLYAADANAQYDQYQLHARMVNAMGIPSPHVTQDLEDQDIVEAMIVDQVAATYVDREDEIPIPEVHEGETSRTVLAEWARAAMESVSGVDFSKVSDTEILDVIQYFVFPNMVPWGGMAFPLTYRVRPWGSDPDYSLFEVMLMASVPEGAELPPDTPMRILGDDEPWANATELGGLGAIVDQDTANLTKVQRGLKSRGLQQVVFSDVQERNIRQFHDNVRRYVDGD